jgi:hypothetical protein
MRVAEVTRANIIDDQATPCAKGRDEGMKMVLG